MKTLAVKVRMIKTLLILMWGLRIDVTWLWKKVDVRAMYMKVCDKARRIIDTE